MKASQFISRYIDPGKMTAAFFAELKDALSRQGVNDSEDLLQAMYGNEREDLELEQIRLDLIKTHAEVDELLASAAKDRADADRS
ncbi:hypothetical protein [Methylobacterium sp. SyP6R]|uniref:hypothetical protein n=1 Tax=Methylobacterium sp. SyP6R TaxID=2718876 RepID=UPI001F18C519|nr:hypothetical protein [Methylobacterium sp. SyP6R]MCF4129013.1 hypothetical protein [Methylobacterium sp. SyP6R]